jgi:hypothetical protein
MYYAGGKRGRQVKKKREFRELVAAYCKKKGVDPFEFFVDVIAGEAIVGKDEHIRIEHKLTAAKELAQYLQSKLRSVEVTVVPEVPKVHTDAEVRHERIAALEKKRTAVMPIELVAGEPGSEAL